MGSFRWIWRTLLVLIVPAVIFILVPFLLSFMFDCGMIEVATFFPEDGTWYCEDLQIQLSFDAPDECFIIIDNEKI